MGKLKGSSTTCSARELAAESGASRTQLRRFRDSEGPARALCALSPWRYSPWENEPKAKKEAGQWGAFASPKRRKAPCQDA